MKKILLIGALALIAACKKDGEESDAEGGGTEVKDLSKSLPLTIEAPKAASVNDMSRGKRKSVLIDDQKGFAINIAPTEDDLAKLKKSIETDTVVDPFKKFAKEDKNSVVYEFDAGGSSGFRGVMLLEIGGAKYRCQTAGMKGMKDAKAAEDVLKACSTVKAK